MEALKQQVPKDKEQVPKDNIMERTIAGFKMRMDHMKDKPRAKSRQIWYQAMIDYMQASITAREEGRPFGWVGIQAPPEILYAMDIPPFYYEHWSLVAASQKAVIPFLEAAEGDNLKDLCSVHKAYCGALKLKQLPRPDFILGNTFPCDAVLFGNQIASWPEKHTPCVCKADGCVGGYCSGAIPLFQLDGPYWYDKEALDYYSKEIKRSIEFVEKVTGRKMDYDKLKHHVNLTNEAFYLLGENNQLIKNIPCPRRSRDLMREPFVLTGQQAAIDYWQAAQEDMKAIMATGKGAVPNERIRLGWLNVPPYGFMGVLDELEKEFGVVVIQNNLSGGFLMSDGENGEPMYEIFPDDPIRTMASKGLCHYGSTCYKDPERYLKVLKRMVEGCQLDGVVLSAHWGCKNLSSIMKHIREDLYAATGVPMLVLESDCLDARTGNVSRLVALMREFVEMLDQKTN
jgi:benzoyl-CoA reductase/2-hydroxyglutaryl-CoA dehydratase subunit BcrC/BadD/HgdB